MTAENRCIRCGRPTPDGYACAGETRKAAEQLRLVCDTVPAARDVAHGLSRRGGGGNASGKPGSQIPIDLTAMARLDAIRGNLVRWARHIARERQGATWVWTDDPISEAAMWLTSQLEWMRHQPDREPDQDGNTWGADQFLTDVDACARVVAGIARGPAPQKYLGPCGALCEPWSDEHGTEHTECPGDVYGRPDGAKGRCRTCGAEHEHEARRIWLQDQARSSDLAWTARGIADALGLNPKTLRAWATERRAPNGIVLRRAKLSTYWRDQDHLVPWVEPREGENVKDRGDRLHYVADVVDLAREVAARRAESDAAREREDVGVAS